MSFTYILFFFLCGTKIGGAFGLGPHYKWSMGPVQEGDPCFVLAPVDLTKFRFFKIFTAMKRLLGKL